MPGCSKYVCIQTALGKDNSFAVKAFDPSADGRCSDRSNNNSYHIRKLNSCDMLTQKIALCDAGGLNEMINELMVSQGLTYSDCYNSESNVLGNRPAVSLAFGLATKWPNDERIQKNCAKTVDILVRNPHYNWKATARNCESDIMGIMNETSGVCYSSDPKYSTPISSGSLPSCASFSLLLRHYLEGLKKYSSYSPNFGDFGGEKEECSKTGIARSSLYKVKSGRAICIMNNVFNRISGSNAEPTPFLDTRKSDDEMTPLLDLMSGEDLPKEQVQQVGGVFVSLGARYCIPLARSHVDNLLCQF